MRGSHIYKYLFAAVSLCLLTSAGCSRYEPPAQNTVRVVSLAPSITEIVCAVGGEELLVGRTSACDYPKSIIDNVPVIGSFGKPSLETLLAAQPTIVLDAALADEAMGQKMVQLGLKRERISCRQIHEIPPAIRLVGELIGHAEEAEALASEIERKLKELDAAAHSSTNRPKIYIETWHTPLWTAGKKTHLSEMIRLAGGVNAGDSVKKEHFQVSHEWVLAENPDIIMCLYMASKQPARETILKRPGWTHVNAVLKNNVFDGFNNDIMLRPGPRIIEGIEAFKRCIDESN